MSLNVVDLYTKDSAAIVYSQAEKKMDFVTPAHEEGFCLIVKNSGANPAVLTVKEGNSIYAMGDYAVTVKSGEDVMINLKNTGRFKNVSGENSGKIIVEVTDGTEADLSVCVLSL